MDEIEELLTRGVANIIPTFQRKITRPVLDTLWKFGGHLDNAFRQMAYLTEVERITSKARLMQTGKLLTSFQDDFASQLRRLQRPENIKEVKQIVERVDDIFYNYQNLTLFERRLIRRFAPFYSCEFMGNSVF